MTRKLLKSLISISLLIGGLSIVYVNRIAIYDWERLRNYHPDQNIVSLADQTTMTQYGRKLFYVSYPKVEQKADFNKDCSVVEQTIVLGCYSANRIYIYRVDDVRLNGVDQVTAAHETLHAAYARLSPSEKAHINSLLEAAYRSINDQALNQTIANYRKTEPGQTDNELHSILATEYTNLGPELEAYYRQYFSNRSQIVGYANQYKQVFQSIKDQVSADDAKLALLKNQIDQLEADLTAQYEAVQNERTQLQAQMNTLSPSAYNYQVSIFNNSVDSYNSQVSYLRSLIANYNALVVERNNLVVQQQGLANSLNSNVTTVSGQ